MPLETTGDSTQEGFSFCPHCVNEDGSVKTCEEIFEGGVQFFMMSIPGTARDLAEKLTRKNMRRQPYWQGKECDCLTGEQATDEEFASCMEKL